MHLFSFGVGVGLGGVGRAGSSSFMNASGHYHNLMAFPIFHNDSFFLLNVYQIPSNNRNKKNLYSIPVPGPL